MKFFFCNDVRLYVDLKNTCALFVLFPIKCMIIMRYFVFSLNINFNAVHVHSVEMIYRGTCTVL